MKIKFFIFYMYNKTKLKLIYILHFIKYNLNKGILLLPSNINIGSIKNRMIINIGLRL